jgi:hypothetical protein
MEERQDVCATHPSCSQPLLAPRRRRARRLSFTIPPTLHDTLFSSHLVQYNYAWQTMVGSVVFVLARPPHGNACKPGLS